MGTKTIGLDDEAYEKLKAEKRSSESFSDTVKRLTDEVAADWRHALGKYSEQASAFESAVQDGRKATAEGLSRRQRAVSDLLGAEDRSEE